MSKLYEIKNLASSMPWSAKKNRNEIKKQGINDRSNKSLATIFNEKMSMMALIFQ